MSKKIYDASNVNALTPIEAIRAKSGMYIGDTGPGGLHHLLKEVISNSQDEIANKYGNELIVTLHQDDYIEVVDNGRGIPVDIHPKFKIPALTLIMTTPHSGGKLDMQSSNYKTSVGTNGLGIFLLNCLTEETIVTIRRDRTVYQEVYSRGVVKTPLKEIGKLNTNATGTSIKWKADKLIFSGGVSYDPGYIRNSLRVLSYMLPGAKLIFQDRRVANTKEWTEEIFESQNGITDLLGDIVKGKNTLFRNPFQFTETEKSFSVKQGENGEPVNFDYDVNVEVVFNIVPGMGGERIISYVNGNEVPMGGTMVTGFKNGFTKAINHIARDNRMLKEKDSNFTFNELADGMYMVINIDHPDPMYESQTKLKLNNPHVSSVVSNMVANKLIRYGIDNPREIEKLIDLYIRLRKGRIAQQNAMNKVLSKVITPGGPKILLGQFLTDATRRGGIKDSDCELYIVEGRSALEGCKSGRDSTYQAIMPLRGKIINGKKCTLEALLKNNEVQALIKALGIGTTQSGKLKVEKCRYGKVVILTDADSRSIGVNKHF
ncbi:MAG: toprim domain-containing protein [Peptostreptococcaceae bacterium]